MQQQRVLARREDVALQEAGKAGAQATLRRLQFRQCATTATGRANTSRYRIEV